MSGRDNWAIHSRPVGKNRYLASLWTNNLVPAQQHLFLIEYKMKPSENKVKPSEYKVKPIRPNMKPAGFLEVLLQTSLFLSNIK